MIIFKCGSCGMPFQVTEEKLLERRSQRCPNCYETFPNDCISSIIEMIYSNKKWESQAYLVEDKDIKGVITGTVTL
jgi:protein-arginine kinase activator protein McsA